MNKLKEMISAGSELLVHRIVVVQALMAVPKCPWRTRGKEVRNSKSSGLDGTIIICGERGEVGIFHVLSIYDFLLREVYFYDVGTWKLSISICMALLHKLLK